MSGIIQEDRLRLEGKYSKKEAQANGLQDLPIYIAYFSILSPDKWLIATETNTCINNYFHVTISIR